MEERREETGRKLWTRAAREGKTGRKILSAKSVSNHMGVKRSKTSQKIDSRL